MTDRNATQKNTQTLNTGHIVIADGGTPFHVTMKVKNGGTYAADAITGGELLQINTDAKVPADYYSSAPEWAAQDKIKWAVALGPADEEGRIVTVVGDAGLNREALIGLTTDNAPELLAQGFKLLEQA